MELRLLRYFVAVAEELHFARAAERLGVEQSPVSRAMRNLEATLGVQLFDRSAHQTRLTWAGQVFLGECRRVLATVEQAVSAAKAAAQGYQGYLRIAICDSLAQPHIATLLARSREEEPELEIRVFELPFAQQLKGLHNDLLDIGFALSDAVSEGLVAEPVWTDPLSVIVPVRHPLLAHAEVPLDEALKFPLVLCHPDAGSGCHHQIQAVLQGASAAQAGRSGDEPRRDADSGRCRLWPRFRHCLAGADPESPRHNRSPLGRHAAHAVHLPAAPQRRTL